MFSGQSDRFGRFGVGARRERSSLYDILRTARHVTAGVKSFGGVRCVTRRDATSCGLLASTGAVRMRRYSPLPASLYGIDRKAEGGAAGEVRHRMIALIRADGRLGKRAVWSVSRGWLRVNLRGWKLTLRGGDSGPVLVTGMARLPTNQLAQDEHPAKRNPRGWLPRPHPHSYPRHGRLLN